MAEKDGRMESKEAEKQYKSKSWEHVWEVVYGIN